MAVYPNSECELFCFWMLNVSWQRLSPPRSLLVNTVYNACVSQSTVTDTEWNNFTQITAWRKPYFEVWRDYASGYSPTAIAYFAAMSPQPSLTWKTQVNAFINDLINLNLLSSLEVLYLFATEHQQHATINLINPSTYLISAVNSPTYTMMEGFTGNGSNAYLNTFVNIAATSIFTQNNNSSGIYIRTNVAETKCDYGGAGGNYLALYSRNASNFCVAHSVSSSSFSNANSDSRGLIGTMRTSSTNSIMHRNGAQLGSASSNASGAAGSNPITILNTNGTSLYSSKQVSMFFLGNGTLSISDLYNAIQNLATAQGWQV